MNTRPHVNAFVQARMSSARFPGKVLAPLTGVPILSLVVQALWSFLPRERVIVLTSTETSDDPIVAYARHLGVPLFRGSLTDVVGRFLGALDVHPADAFLRVCGDSPLLDAKLMAATVDYARSQSFDVITNTHPRSFPRGQSMELVNSEPFRKLATRPLTAEDREHVTGYFYRNDASFRVLNVTCADPVAAGQSLAVDTLEDLRRIESMLAQGHAPSYPWRFPS